MIKQTKQDMINILTESIRTVPVNQLGLQCVRFENNVKKVRLSSIEDAVSSYGADDAPLEAWINVLAYSECPYVQTYREALAQRYAHYNAEDVESA